MLLSSRDLSSHPLGVNLGKVVMDSAHIHSLLSRPSVEISERGENTSHTPSVVKLRATPSCLFVHQRIRLPADSLSTYLYPESLIRSFLSCPGSFYLHLCLILVMDPPSTYYGTAMPTCWVRVLYHRPVAHSLL